MPVHHFRSSGWKQWNNQHWKLLLLSQRVSYSVAARNFQTVATVKRYLNTSASFDNGMGCPIGPSDWIIRANVHPLTVSMIFSTTVVSEDSAFMPRSLIRLILGSYFSESPLYFFLTAETIVHHSMCCYNLRLVYVGRNDRLTAPWRRLASRSESG